MKKCFLSLAVGVLLLLPEGVLAGNELPWEKQLPFKEATILYVISGIEEGKENLYIRDSGKERMTQRETVSNIMGMKMLNSTITIKTPEFIYSYDLQKQQGLKAVNPQKFMIEEYNKLSQEEQERVRESVKKMGAAYAEGMGGAMQANAVELLGYSCDKVEIMDGSATYLIHDTDVTLKTEMNLMGKNLTMLAETIDTGKVDGKYFEHPVGIVAEVSSQSDDIAKNMAIQAIAMLKSPQGAHASSLVPKVVSDGKKQMTAEEKEEMVRQMEHIMKGLQEKATE